VCVDLYTEHSQACEDSYGFKDIPLWSELPCNIQTAIRTKRVQAFFQALYEGKITLPSDELAFQAIETGEQGVWVVTASLNYSTSSPPEVADWIERQKANSWCKAVAVCSTGLPLFHGKLLWVRADDQLTEAEARIISGLRTLAASSCLCVEREASILYGGVLGKLLTNLYVQHSGAHTQSYGFKDHPDWKEIEAAKQLAIRIAKVKAFFHDIRTGQVFDK